MTNIVPYDPDMDDGLEDLDQSDMTLPRLKISHSEGVFIDGLSNEKLEEIDGIVLGLIKQRVLWDPVVDDDAKPLCKSWDNSHGFPQDKFPWASTPFDPDLPNEEGFEGLPCEACPLKEWGSHPSPGTKTPWCTQQHVLPIATATPTGGVTAQLVTFQKSGAKPTTNYLMSFKRDGRPAFTRRTKITLKTEKRGSVVYSTPEFMPGDDVPEELWGVLSANLRSIRDFLRTPFKPRDDEDKAAPAAATPPQAKASKPAPQAAAPTTAASTPAASDEDDEEEPW